MLATLASHSLLPHSAPLPILGAIQNHPPGPVIPTGAGLYIVDSSLGPLLSFFSRY
jgi:hypothetical protein